MWVYLHMFYEYISSLPSDTELSNLNCYTLIIPVLHTTQAIVSLAQECCQNILCALQKMMERNEEGPFIFSVCLLISN